MLKILAQHEAVCAAAVHREFYLAAGRVLLFLVLQTMETSRKKSGEVQRTSTHPAAITI